MRDVTAVAGASQLDLSQQTVVVLPGSQPLANREEEGGVVLRAAITAAVCVLRPLLAGDASHIHMPRHKQRVCSVRVKAQELRRREQGCVAVICEAGCCKVWCGPAWNQAHVNDGSE